jgi:diguanylate cyclase (GGDEF)-like protein
MIRHTALRSVVGLFAPGGVLVLAAWAIQQEDVVRGIAEPYAVFFCYGALAAAVLLSWYYDQSRLLCCAAAVTLCVWRMAQWPGDPSFGKLVAFLLPLNFMIFAALKERGVLTFDGLLKIAFIVVQVAGMTWVVENNSVAQFLRWGDQPGAWLWLPAAARLTFAVAVATILALVFMRRTKVEEGMLWALVAVFLGLSQIDKAPALLFYWGAAGLILVLAVLEHGYDIAYRDELTGLPGRRAFNNVMGQLGGHYAIAMCDVDHFKRFNDTYGHEAGDQLLKMVGAELLQVGGGGRAFRYGGEEFLIVFRGRSALEAQPFAESLRQTIADARVGTRRSNQPAGGISVSIGIGEKSKRHSTPELVLEAADAALYRAKEAGRNCVRLEDGAASAAS